MAQRASGALLLNLIAVTWFFVKGVSAEEAASAPYNRPEVVKRAGRRAGASPAVNAGIPVHSAAQVQPHPGTIVTVVVVGLLAFLSASYIVRKYCFPQSNQTYTYSTLRRHEEQHISEESAPCRQHLDSIDSDEEEHF